MSYQPQHIEAPDGTELVVITRTEYERLRASVHDSDDAREVQAADAARAESDVRYPATVMDAMLAGATPIAAWRKYRKLSQAELADRAGVTQTAISRLERSGKDGLQPLGRRATRQAIARALNLSLAALEPLDG